MAATIACFDDHPIFLDGLTRLFESSDEYEVVAVGSCASDIAEAAAKHRPDVLLVDLSMPGNVFEAIQSAVHVSPSSKIVAFTASAGVDIAVRTLESGATGYVLKGSSAAELFAAISCVLGGDTFVTPSFATKVIASLRQAVVRGSAGHAIRFTVREDQIVRLLQRGRTNKEIALHLSISEKTVKHYMTLLMQKLNVRNRVEVIIAARELTDRGGDALGSTSSRH